jgi:hypothetical protein
MASEMGYPDSVDRDAGAHGPDSQEDNSSQTSANTSAGEGLKHMGPARTEFAAPGHAGRSETTTPIGPQSGFAPLGEEKAPHGSGEYTGDESNYRQEWGSKV